MAGRRLTFGEWRDRVLRCAALMRSGASSAAMRRVSDNVMRYCYALVCHLAAHPNDELTRADYELCLARHGERMRRYNPGPLHPVEWTDERLARRKTRPPEVSEARWRMHLHWRKHR